jgi:putative Mg2+ transporter-C (MgtC) family protein
MGFIGGGAILKRDGKVEGTATAASLWATGAMGMAVAYARLDIGIAISLIVFLTLRILTPLEERLLEDSGKEGEVQESTPGDEASPASASSDQRYHAGLPPD